MTFSALGFCEIIIARQKPCKLLRCCCRRCCFCLTTAKSAQKLWAIFTMFVFHWVGEKVYLSFERCWRCLLGWQRPSSSDWNTDKRWWYGHEQQQRVISGCNKTGKFWHLSSFLDNTRFFSCPARAVVAVAAFVAVAVVVVTAAVFDLVAGVVASDAAVAAVYVSFTAIAVVVVASAAAVSVAAFVAVAAAFLIWLLLLLSLLLLLLLLLLLSCT